MTKISILLRGDPGEAALAVRRQADLYASRGLSLTAAEAGRVAAVHVEAMAENRLIEVGHGSVKRIMDEFAQSPYVDRQNFAEVLEGMCEAFAFLKREAEREVADADLLAAMRRLFDGPSGGSVELFLSREMEALRRRLSDGGTLDRIGEEEYGDDETDGEG